MRSAVCKSVWRGDQTKVPSSRGHEFVFVKLPESSRHTPMSAPEEKGLLPGGLAWQCPRHSLKKACCRLSQRNSHTRL